MATKKLDFSKRETITQPSPHARAAVLSMLTGNIGNAPAKTESEQDITELDLALIDNHPQQYRWSMNEDELNWLTSNIAAVGVLEPIQVMQQEKGRYMCLAGHRRCEAARRAGLKTVPAIVHAENQEKATIIFNATNLGHRQVILPSEKAFAYCDLAAVAGEKSTSAIAQLTGDNIRMIQRFKRLALLIPDLLSAVDIGDIPAGGGEALSYLSPAEQNALLTVLQERNSLKLSLKQAKALKSAGEECEHELVPDTITRILFPTKEQKPKLSKVSLNIFSRFLPKSITAEKDIVDYISKALEAYRQE